MVKKPTRSSKPDNDDEEIESTEPDEATPDENPPEGEPKSGTEEPADSPPAAGSHNVTVQGKGSLSVMADGKANTVERGKKVKVSPELLEALKAMGEQVEEDNK